MPQHTFDSLVTQATVIVGSLITSKHNFNCEIHSSLQNVENANNEDILKEDALDIARSMEKILFDDYLLQTVDSEPVELDILAPSVDVTLMRQLLQDMGIHWNLLKELSFKMFADFEPPTLS
ncbi:hypothetical protein C0995_012344 [Termitomyces sp. Mi166|nr:hypothetical protein C0995_012344 [Termitomyces sp. Mi166\